MLPYEEWAGKRASRRGEIIAGVVFALFGTLSVVSLALVIYKASKSGSLTPSTMTGLAIVTLLSVFFCLTAFRLLTGRGRSKDGGLFSPWVLRSIGLIFLG